MSEKPVELIKTKPKIVRITTQASSMNVLFKNQLKFINNYFNVIGITSPDEMYYSEIANREGIKLKGVKLSRKITPFKDLISLWRIYNILKAEKPVIVHTHTPKAGFLGMMAAYFSGVPYRLHTVAGLPLLERKGLLRKILNNVERLTSAFATNVYPNSSGLKKIILDNKFCPESKLKVIANGSTNGIDLDFFSDKEFENIKNFKEDFRKKIGIDKDDIVFCFVGRIVKEKGITELVTSFIKLYEQSSNKNIKLLMVGPMRKEDDPVSELIDSKIHSHCGIIYVGLQRDIRPYLFISNIFVFPSYREGFPNVVLQAGAMNLPSIVSNINGCNEIIKDKFNGLIVPARDSVELLKAMEYFLKFPDKIHEMGSRSREVISKKYEQKLVHSQLLKEYTSMINPDNTSAL